MTRRLKCSEPPTANLEKIEWTWRSTARVVITSCSAIPALLQTLRDEGENLLLTASQLIEAGVLAAVALGTHQQIDDPRVDDRSPPGDFTHSSAHVPTVLDTVLEQVGAAVRASLQKLGGNSGSAY